MCRGTNVAARGLARNVATNDKAVAFLAPWRLKSIPERKQLSNRSGHLAPSRPRVAQAVAVSIADKNVRATAHAIGN